MLLNQLIALMQKSQCVPAPISPMFISSIYDQWIIEPTVIKCSSMEHSWVACQGAPKSHDYSRLLGVHLGLRHNKGTGKWLKYGPLVLINNHNVKSPPL